ncbi:class I SAM-dependent methyltransferase [Kibdelosporangium aridum]|uniref:Class I SAM-dependent methyltransferase n=1 Tax=Kibdelosporangium aridum TaxID=2030 RepID=A0A428Y350_KIBAR|nr:class I SAM-dependent methyltransferase [Kibdelosporangium aridum]RSM61991.1 class I SAM-dependent methyltransferase [Kibdelosporangium aridum]
MTIAEATAVDTARLERLLGAAVTDAGATSAAGLIVLGERLGLWAALADGPLTTAELAARTGTVERHVREWARAQAAGGYLTYHAGTAGDTELYSLDPEQTLAFDPDGPVNLGSMFRLAVTLLRGLDRLETSMRTGRGIGYDEQDDAVVSGIADFFRAGYTTHLLDEWIPSLEGVSERLTAGARVADVGCGHGITTILLAQRFPASTFHGFDFDPGSIEQARAAATDAGVADRVHFELCDATEIPALGYDLVCTFDALHDYGQPDHAARRVRECLEPGGSWMVVEPKAGDTVADNLNPVGRLYYSGSTYLCVPNSLSQGGAALGAQAGEQALRQVISGAGFGDVRVTAETPFNIVLHARV